jgi:hypothetical protein
VAFGQHEPAKRQRGQREPAKHHRGRPAAQAGLDQRPGQPGQARQTGRLGRPIKPGTALADAIITVRSLIRQAWITYRWDDRPARRP